MRMKLSNLKIHGKWKGRLTILCCLLFLVVGIIGGTVAAYTSVASGSSGAVKVASYAVSAGASNGNKDLTIDCNKSTHVANYEFWIKNSVDGKTTEVDVKYSTVVSFSKPLPNGLTVQLDGESGSMSADRLTCEFTNDSWVFNAGVDSTANHTLTFIADTDVITSNLSVSGITITVNTEQID